MEDVPVASTFLNSELFPKMMASSVENGDDDPMGLAGIQIPVHLPMMMMHDYSHTHHPQVRGIAGSEHDDYADEREEGFGGAVDDDDDDEDEPMDTRAKNKKKPLDKRRQWSKDDDLVILQFVRDCGTKRWSKISELLPGRTPKQCRTRYDRSPLSI